MKKLSHSSCPQKWELLYGSVVVWAAIVLATSVAEGFLHWPPAHAPSVLCTAKVTGKASLLSGPSVQASTFHSLSGVFSLLQGISALFILSALGHIPSFQYPTPLFNVWLQWASVQDYVFLLLETRACPE